MRRMRTWGFVAGVLTAFVLMTGLAEAATESKLRGDRATVQIPLPGIRVAGEDLGYLVGTGGCVPDNGEVPPCVPPIPLPVFRAKVFRTFKPTLLEMKAQVAVASRWARDGATEGSAEVQVQLEVDGNLNGEGKTFTLTGDQERTLKLNQRFLLPAGKHQIGLKLTGTGFNYVNVEGKSARVKSYLSKTFRIK